MDNKTALVFAIILTAIFALDGWFFDFALMLEIGKLVTRLSDWLAFWRRL